METLNTDGTVSAWLFFFSTVASFAWAAWMGYCGLTAAHPPYRKGVNAQPHIPADGPVFVGEAA